MKIRVFVYWKYLKVSRCFFKYKQRDVFLYTKGCIVAQDDGERCPNKVAGVVPPDGCRCSLRCGTRPDGCIPENPSFRYGVLAGRRVRMPEADPAHLSPHSSISSGSDLRFSSAALHVPVRSSSRLHRKWPALNFTRLRHRAWVLKRRGVMTGEAGLCTESGGDVQESGSVAGA